MKLFEFYHIFALMQPGQADPRRRHHHRPPASAPGARKSTPR